MIAERRRDQKQTIRKEVSSHFLGKRTSRHPLSLGKRPKRPAWKHRFVCLGYYGQDQVPTTDADKDELFEAGLGEKEVEFERLDLDVTQFHDVIYKAFPNLQEGGGFPFCKCLPKFQSLKPLSKRRDSYTYIPEIFVAKNTTLQPDVDWVKGLKIHSNSTKFLMEAFFESTFHYKVTWCCFQYIYIYYNTYYSS